MTCSPHLLLHNLLHCISSNTRLHQLLRYLWLLLLCNLIASIDKILIFDYLLKLVRFTCSQCGNLFDRILNRYLLLLSCAISYQTKNSHLNYLVLCWLSGLLLCLLGWLPSFRGSAFLIKINIIHF